MLVFDSLMPKVGKKRVQLLLKVQMSEELLKKVQEQEPNKSCCY